MFRDHAMEASLRVLRVKCNK